MDEGTFDAGDLAGARRDPDLKRHRLDAEARLQAHLDQFRGIVENAEAGYFRIGLDGRYQDVNPAWLRMYGVACREDVVGQHFEAFQVPGDKARAEVIAGALMRGEVVPSGEFSRLRRDGTTGYHSFSASPVFEDGRIAAIEGFLVDTTERRLAAAQVSELEKVLHAAQAAAQFGVFKWDARTGKSQWSPEAYQFYGLDPETTEPGLEAWLQTVHPEDRDRVLQDFQGTLQSPDGRLNIEYRSACGLRWIAGVGQLYRDPAGHPDHMVGINIEITARKAAERERQLAEQRYRALFTSMQEGVALHRLIYSDGVPRNYMLIDVNRRYEELIGVRREQVVDRLATAVYSTAEPPYLTEYAAVVATGTPFRFETYFPPMDRHFAISVAPMGGDLFATIFFDITDQKNVERTLRHSREQFESLARNIPGVVFQFFTKDDGKWGFHYLSERCLDVAGISPEPLATAFQRLIACLHPEDRLRCLESIRASVAAGSRWEFEGRAIKPTGEVLFFNGIADARRGEGETVFRGILLDVTNRKLTENALQLAHQSLAAAERHYRVLFNSVSDAVLVFQLEPDGLSSRFLEANGNACRLLGYSREELLLMRVGDIDAPENHASALAVVRRLLAGADTVRESTFVARDGRRIPVEIHTHPFELDGAARVISSVRDVTERKQAEAARQKLEEQLRQAQKLESVGRLAGGVAHDFNNLLTVINGYADFLASGLDPHSSLWNSAEEIRKAGERAAALTRQLLAFSRKQIIQPRPLDLNTAIRDSERMLRRLIGEDVALSTTLDPHLGRVLADPEQIQQVIMNLLVNSRDAMPDGGRLEIATANLEIREPGASGGARPCPCVMMSVTDNGSGMDEETRQHIFEPFFTTKEAGKGTGLGLSTVYGIVRQNGGWIDVWSESGAGSSFKIYLPRVDGDQTGESRDGARPAARHGGQTILVVEDQDAVRRLTKAVLAAYGYHVLEAANGDDALDAALKYAGEIHLLLADVVLPGMNGKELSDRLKTLRPTIKVLFTSGYSVDVIAHKGVLDSGVEYIPKPFHPAKLAANVRDLLSPSAPPAV